MCWGFVGKTEIIYRARALKQLRISKCICMLFLWGEDVSLECGWFSKCACTKAQLAKERHVWEQKQARRHETRTTWEQVAISKTHHTLTFTPLHTRCCCSQPHRGFDWRFPPSLPACLCAFSTSRFAWRYSVTGLSSVSCKCGLNVVIASAGSLTLKIIKKHILKKKEKGTYDTRVET